MSPEEPPDNRMSMRGPAFPNLPDRLDTVRERLRTDRVRGHQVGFAAGYSYRPIHGDADVALKEAGEAMYADKPTKPGGRRRAG